MDPTTPISQPKEPNVILPPAEPASTPQETSSRVLILIAGLVLLFGGLGGGLLLNKYLAQKQSKSVMVPQFIEGPIHPPTVNLTANWQTYEDKVLNFSLQYPQNWYSGRFDLGTRIKIYLDKDPVEKPLKIGATTSDFKAFKIIVSRLPLRYGGISFTKTQKSEITIDGVPAQKIVVPAPINNPDINKTVVTVEKGNYQYFFEYDKYGDKERDSYFDKILSTFKFISQQ
ncbi:hypothetical protein HY086_05640 [Candidatus Gottesmanbacteria bacterium]|nr:hypothetical protein [Candidatus Gottesmanbacteria bacterium]